MDVHGVAKLEPDPRMRSRPALVLATLLAASPVVAQSQAGVPTGVQMRLTLADGSRRSGWVAGSDSATLRLAGDVDEDARYWRTIPLASVRSYQIARGHRRGHAALIGMGVGGAIGLGLIGAGVYADAHASDPMIPSEVVTLPLALGATLIGTGIGALAAPTRWSAPVRLARTAAALPVRPYVHDHSLGIAVAMRF